jgi:hypothetical protein
MKTPTPGKFKQANSLLVVLLLSCTACLHTASEPTTVQGVSAGEPSLRGPFYVRSYVGKCLTYGVSLQVTSEGAAQPTGSSPVYIYDCNTASRRPIGIQPIEPILQQVVVAEINERHEVVLRAGNKVIGVTANFLVEQAPLELQDETRLPAQVFALDGDSIILAADRNLVVKVKNGRGANLTPLVLGRRDLADSEFWDFNAADGSVIDATRGFMRVRTLCQFWNAIQLAAWGSVIKIDPDAVLNFELLGECSADGSTPTFRIPDGVTIRGDRRGTRPGPLLFAPHSYPLFEMANAPAEPATLSGNHVRITGLRLQGRSGGRSEDLPASKGIAVRDDLIVIIDHNDMHDWTTSAVTVSGPQSDWKCHPRPDFRPQNVRVVRNFIHHNQRQGLGYGVDVDSGYPSIVGNTFLLNRHAIAADGNAFGGYSAWFNLVLSEAPRQEWLGGIIGSYTQDFDMHGSDSSSHHVGGIGGSDVEIARNTFLGTNRRNFDLRGVSCGLVQFHHNVSRQSKRDAIEWYIEAVQLDFHEPWRPALCARERLERVDHLYYCGYQTSPYDDPPLWLEIPNNNRFESKPDPTGHLGVGDFDGDGKDDLFLATGQAWYFAPAGKAEWRFLNAQTDEIGSLLFGDFDGDGRTDVFTQHGRDWLVSWGGASPWEKINESDARMTEFAIGDFDGDRRADVFYADGRQWFVSYAGRGPFVPVQTSGFRVRDLGFGDFDGDGRTDVFGVVGREWRFSRSARAPWSEGFLRPALTNTAAGLIVADFNGDGRADVGTSEVKVSYGGSATVAWEGKVSFDGRADWTPLRTPAPSLRTQGSYSFWSTEFAAIGRFDDDPGADILFWNGSRSLDIVSSGTAAPHLHGRQDMR